MDEVVRRYPDLAGLGKSAVSAVPGDDELFEESEYRRLRGEAERGIIDSSGWAAMLRTASKLAAHKRDLRIYNYLCFAVCAERKENPYVPLAAVLLAYRDLIAEAWKSCEPADDKSRVGTIYLLDHELHRRAESWLPKDKDALDLGLLIAAAASLARAARPKLGLDEDEDEMGLSKLRDKLAEHLARLAKKPSNELKVDKKADKKEEPESRQTAEKQQTGESRRPVDKFPDEHDREFIHKVRGLLPDMARQLRLQDLYDPAAYWLLRAVLFSGHFLLTEAEHRKIVGPDAGKEDRRHKTPLPKPTNYEEIQKRIEIWFPQEGQPKSNPPEEYEELLRTTEAAISSQVLWLDLHYIVAACLARLGRAPAEMAVRGEIAHLLARFPRLPYFCFSGDKPFAGPHTIRWLRSEIMAQGRSGPETASGVAAAPRPAELREALRQQDVELQKATSGRERFLMRLGVARLCLAQDRADLAVPLLEDLQRDAESYRLDEWEPALSAESLDLLLKAIGRLGSDGPLQARLWARLCRLSPGLAERGIPEPRRTAR